MKDFSKYFNYKYHKTKNNCYTLAKEVFSDYNIDIDAITVNADNKVAVFRAVENQKYQWKKIDTPVEPCLVAISNNGIYIDHIGVYIGNGQFIHFLKEGVFISKIKDFKYNIRGYYVKKN